jgi:glycosyltransferase involved in cell wall biosynthesis
MAELRLFVYWLPRKVDVVHYMDGEHGIGIFPAMADKVPLRKKPLIVATYHQPADILSNLVNQRILNSIDLIIVLCESQRKYLSAFVPVEKIHVIYHGVDNEYFHRITKTYSSDAPLKCLSVGSWLRDYETILRTAELVCEHNIEFHIVNQAMSEDVGSNIVLYKDLTDKELLRLYQESDILFLPFKDATANNVVLEGMACGLAVMSNNIDSIKEYLGDNVQLILDNAPGLYANKLIEISRDPKILGSLSLRSIGRAEELSWKNIANQYEQLFSCSLVKGGN